MNENPFLVLRGVHLGEEVVYSWEWHRGKIGEGIDIERAFFANPLQIQINTLSYTKCIYNTDQQEKNYLIFFS